ncbi:uncharacterized protein N7496_005532 [Penicillium cataractarum]|uniref:Zn(2)-C6 fungal-type domain-containing protein n=1 Tax=Penicillium cataractarum TaxID=2100454 RepID=A0A9W9SGE5_9EURO|nr:uncharacterized protein N7496_005532 [Penicillium cataractarum]KAJ5378123.1 hypothetical protein N7496_005532 [Penicillium cataractarum]
MIANDNETAQPPGRATRSSLACAPCRYKHLRCDGKKPACSRCTVDKKECTYHASRRRGNPRQKQSQESSTTTTTVSDSSPASILENQRYFDLPVQVALNNNNVDLPQANSESILLGLYYEFFHAAHPCVLPRQFLNTYANQSAIQPLLLVLNYIGSLFASSMSSDSLHQEIQTYLVSIRNRTRSITGFDVQAVLLCSIAIYWCNEPDAGVELVDEAIRLALELGMNRQEYADENSQNDPILAESWRRTWWQIYITDTHIAGSTHKFPFRCSNIEMTVNLPCEERDYESGIIPRPRSLQEYDNREFFSDDEVGFSSYAELIGLTRGIDQALSPGATSDVQLYSSMCSNSDTSVTAWHSLLPNSKRTILRPDGTVDEVMFKAEFIMHTYTIEVHRPMSSLAYSTIEAISRCAPLAPSEGFNCSNSAERQLHTMKCLAAIDKLQYLLTLPTNITTHSPFIICMLANVTIAHLSACRFVLEGKKRTQCREKIRLTMGTLKRLSDYWTLGKRTYREIGIIAREILCLIDKSPTPAPEPLVDSSFVPSAVDLSALGLIPGPDFDFCAFFDSGIGATMEESRQLVL